MKTPEEYFQEKVVLPDETPGAGFTSAERAFLDKYLGVGAGGDLKSIGLDRPVRPEPVPGFATPAPQPAETGQAAATEPGPVFPAGAIDSEDKNEIADLETYLRGQPETQLVSFFLGSSEFALPISVIQEVIRYVPPTKLPTAPSFLAGIVNLRGRVTPLVRPRLLMGGRAAESDEDRFIVVCRRRGLQVGLIIQAVATMYRARQQDIEWGIEASIGVAAEYLLGLLKQEDKLVSVISIDRLVDRVLRS